MNAIVNVSGAVEVTVSQGSVNEAVLTVSKLAATLEDVNKTNKVAKGVISAAVEQAAQRIKEATGALPVVKTVAAALYIPNTMYKLRNMVQMIDSGESDWIGAYHACMDNATTDKKNVCPAYNAAAMAISRMLAAEKKAGEVAAKEEAERLAELYKKQAQQVADKVTAADSSAAVKAAAYSAAIDGLTAGDTGGDVEQAARQAAQQAFTVEQQAAQQAAAEQAAAEQQAAEQESMLAELIQLRADNEMLRADLAAAQAAQQAAEQALQAAQQAGKVRKQAAQQAA